MSVVHQERRPLGAGRRVVKSVRVHDQEWEAALTRAHQEGYTLSKVTATLIAAYRAGKLTPPAGVREQLPGKPPTSRSVRCTREDWEIARVRAASEGHTVSDVVSRIVTGYAHGDLHMPTVEYTFPE